jgi:hypothetical protein
MAVKVFVKAEWFLLLSLIRIHRPEPAGIGIEVSGAEKVHPQVRVKPGDSSGRPSSACSLLSPAPGAVRRHGATTRARSQNSEKRYDRNSRTADHFFMQP